MRKLIEPGRADPRSSRLVFLQLLRGNLGQSRQIDETEIASYSGFAEPPSDALIDRRRSTRTGQFLKMRCDCKIFLLLQWSGLPNSIVTRRNSNTRHATWVGHIVEVGTTVRTDYQS